MVRATAEDLYAEFQADPFAFGEEYDFMEFLVTGRIKSLRNGLAMMDGGGDCNTGIELRRLPIRGLEVGQELDVYCNTHRHTRDRLVVLDDCSTGGNGIPMTAQELYEARKAGRDFPTPVTVTGEVEQFYNGLVILEVVWHSLYRGGDTVYGVELRGLEPEDVRTINRFQTITRTCTVASDVLVLDVCEIRKSLGSPARFRSYPGGYPLDTEFVEAWVLWLTNVERRKAGLKLLVHDPDLSNSARSHSKNMSLFGLAHVIHRRDVDSRAFSFGHCFKSENFFLHYPYHLTENIVERPRITTFEPFEFDSYSRATALGILKEWMNSPDYRANILDRDARTMGVGVAILERPEYDWVQEIVVATQNFSECQ